MVNTELLEKKIANSGLKYNALADDLGISLQAFRLKRINKCPFKGDEIATLCDKLSITSMAELRAIFFSDNVD